MLELLQKWSRESYVKCKVWCSKVQIQSEHTFIRHARRMGPQSLVQCLRLLSYPEPYKLPDVVIQTPSPDSLFCMNHSLMCRNSQNLPFKYAVVASALLLLWRLLSNASGCSSPKSIISFHAEYPSPCSMRCSLA